MKGKAECIRSEIEKADEQAMKLLFEKYRKIPSEIDSFSAGITEQYFLEYCLRRTKIREDSANSLIFYYDGGSTSDPIIEIDNYPFGHHLIHGRTKNLKLYTYMPKTALSYTWGFQFYGEGEFKEANNADMIKMRSQLFSRVPKQVTDTLNCGMKFKAINQGDVMLLHGVRTDSLWQVDIVETNYDELACDTEKLLELYSNYLNDNDSTMLKAAIDEFFMPLSFTLQLD